jgi:hydroxyacylglutathione hydrolase
LPHLETLAFICREDNYGVLIHDPDSGATASIDAPSASAIETYLAQTGWSLTHILMTHHHGDHTEGNLALKERYNCTIIGPSAEAQGIPGMDKGVKGGDTYFFGGRSVEVIDTPGHTKGHIVLHLPTEHLLFAGDTLFALGCGRVIEGTMDQMWASLDALRTLPAATIVHCGHEYTQSNARFALSVEPGNLALVQRGEVIAAKRARNEMTLPTTIGEERATNPFLRPESVEIRTKLGLSKAASNAEVFAATRKAKDNFK